MPYSTGIPNASQSPGLFPAQSITNFTRLKTIIRRDHQFNDSTQDTDGYHRQCTLINRASPTGALPPGSNGILYSWLDGAGQSQLRFYNGTIDYQITPLADGPSKLSGTVTLSGGISSGVLFTIPAYTFGTVFVNYTNPPSVVGYNYYLFFRSGTTLSDTEIIKGGGGTSPTIVRTGSDISVKNNVSGGGNRDVSYYFQWESI